MVDKRTYSLRAIKKAQAYPDQYTIEDCANEDEARNKARIMALNRGDKGARRWLSEVMTTCAEARAAALEPEATAHHCAYCSAAMSWKFPAMSGYYYHLGFCSIECAKAYEPPQATDPDDSGRLAEIEARLAARTPGEWYTFCQDGLEDLAESGFVYDSIRVIRDCDHGPEYRCKKCSVVWQDDGGSIRVRPDDADLIANAPGDLEWSVAEIKRLTEKIATYEKARTISERIDALRDLAGESYEKFADDHGGAEAACDELRGRDPVATPPAEIRVQDLPAPMTPARLKQIDRYRSSMISELMLETKRARFFEDYLESAFQAVADENGRLTTRNGELLAVNNRQRWQIERQSETLTQLVPGWLVSDCDDGGPAKEADVSYGEQRDPNVETEVFIHTPDGPPLVATLATLCPECGVHASENSPHAVYCSRDNREEYS